MSSKSIVPIKCIEQKILLIRSQNVMLDRDLAELYGVTTGNLNKAVNRNLDRFPSDFMFQLSRQEFKNLIFHFGTSSWGGTRKLPRVFTEQGIAMLSEKSLNILKHWNQKSISSLNLSTRLAFNIIGNIPKYLEKEKSDPIANQLQSLHNRIDNINEKLEVIKVWSIAGYSSLSNKQYISQIKNKAVSLNVENLKKFIEFIEGYENENGDNWWENLKDKITKIIITNSENSPNNENNLKKFSFVYFYKNISITTDRIKAVLRKVLASNEHTVELWRNEILKISQDKNKKKLSNWIIQEMMAKIKTSNLPLEFRKELFNLLLDIVSESDEKDNQNMVGNLILSLAEGKYGDDIKDIGINKVKESKKLLGKSVFKTEINTIIQEIFGKESSEIYKKRQFLKSMLDYQNLWDKDTDMHFGSAICKLLRNANQNYVNFTFELLKNTDKKNIRGKKDDIKNSINNNIGNQEDKKKLLKELENKGFRDGK